MVDEIVAIPLNDPKLRVRVLALHKGKEPGPFAYLQGMRSGTLKRIKSDPEQTEAARAYHRNKQRYFPMLAQAVEGPIDAILSPPSSLPWQAEPYRQAIAAAYPNALDLTASFSRSGDARAGTGASFDEVRAGFEYQPSGHETKFRRLVIVDDTFTTGTTAATVVTLLRQHGLSATCDIILACPLWLDTKGSGGSAGR